MLKESGPLYISDINLELGFEANTPFYLDTPLNRQVVGKFDGPIYLSDFYGRGYQYINLNAYSEIEAETQLDSKLNLKILYPAQLPNITVMPIVSENLHNLIFQFFAEYEKDILIPDIKYVSGSYLPKQENINLYAWYKASNDIQITLKHNWTQLANFGEMWLNDADLGVNYTMDDVVVTFSDLWYNNDELTYKIIDYTPKRSGYIFLGWALTETGDVVYKSNEPIYGVLGKFKQNNTLYAKWQKI